MLTMVAMNNTLSYSMDDFSQTDKTLTDSDINDAIIEKLKNVPEQSLKEAVSVVRSMVELENLGKLKKMLIQYQTTYMPQKLLMKAI